MDKEYHRSAAKKHYQENKEQYRVRNEAQRIERRKVVLESKHCGCNCCSETEPCCLEFHHLDPTQKDFAVADRSYANLDRLREEIRKCVVVCSNCHKKIHAGLIKLP